MIKNERKHSKKIQLEKEYGYLGYRDNKIAIASIFGDENEKYQTLLIVTWLIKSGT